MDRGRLECTFTVPQMTPNGWAVMDERNASCLRILVADDNQLMRDGLCAILQEHADWEICGEAADGTQAIQMTLELKPDVLVLDVSMPGLNGFEVAKRIHELSELSWTPDILIVTEHDAATFEHIQPQSGVRAFIGKSRISSDLVPAIEAVAANRHASGQAV